MVCRGVVMHGVARRGLDVRGGGWHGLARRGRARHSVARRGSFNKRRHVRNMKTIEVRIVGVTPFLMHKFSEDAEQAKATRRIQVASRDPREEATKAAYIADDGTYYFSAFSIPNAMASAGANHKMRGSRKTLRFVVPSAVRTTSDTITMLNGDGPAKSFEVDSRPVTIPATKGRIMRHRPRFDVWGARFDLLINDAMLSVEDAHKLLNEAGESIGIGDFRPEKRGPFGTFRVVSFNEK